MTPDRNDDHDSDAPPPTPAGPRRYRRLGWAALALFIIILAIFFGTAPGG